MVLGVQREVAPHDEADGVVPLLVLCMCVVILLVSGYYVFTDYLLLVDGVVPLLAARSLPCLGCGEMGSTLTGPLQK